MRHLVITNIHLGQTDCPLAHLALLDTVAGPHPRPLDALALTPRQAEAVAALLGRVRPPEQEG